MNDVLSLGPFMVRLNLLLIIAAWIPGYLVMYRLFKQTAYHGEALMDKIINSVLIVIAGWKLSPLLYAPSLLWKNPLSLLLINGPRYGVWLGVAAGVCYLLWCLKRMTIPKALVGDLLALGLITSLGAYNLLSWQYGTVTALPWGISQISEEYLYHPINVYQLVILIPIWYWMWKNSKIILGTGQIMRTLLIYGGMGMMAVTLFKVKRPLILNLSGEQIIYLILMLTGYVLFTVMKKKKVADY